MAVGEGMRALIHQGMSEKEQDNDRRLHLEFGRTRFPPLLPQTSSMRT